MLRHLRKKLYINESKFGSKYFSVAIPQKWAYIFENSDLMLLEKLADDRGIIILPAKIIPKDG